MNRILLIVSVFWLAQLVSVAEAKVYKDMVPVPANPPFLIDIFEMDAGDLKSVGMRANYSTDRKVDRVVTLTDAEEYCKKKGKRVPTQDEWMMAASNLGLNKKYTLRGDTLDKVNGVWPVNMDGGEGGISNDYASLGIDAIGTIGMTGNRNEWVVTPDRTTSCGRHWRRKDPQEFELHRLCGPAKVGTGDADEFSDRGGTVRCVVDFDNEAEVQLSEKVTGELKKYITSHPNQWMVGGIDAVVSFGGSNPAAGPTEPVPTIKENGYSSSRKDDPKRLAKPEPGYDLEY